MGRPEIPGLDEILRRDVYEQCFESTDREVGGVLVGRMGASSPPSVEGSIRAVAASETAAQLTFTQDTWEHIHRVLAEEYPSREIVGWYHTHPGYGLFLSEQDRFIHRNFFQNRSQIAVVIDPVAREEAIYAWYGGDLEEYLRRSIDELPPGADSGRIPIAPVLVAPRPQHRIEPGTSVVAGENAYREIPLSTRLSTWIYLAIIGLAAGVIFWALVLR